MTKSKIGKQLSKKSSRKRSSKTRASAPRLSPREMVIADPCGAPVEGARFLSSSSGYVSRFKQDGSAVFHTLAAQATSISGYVAWLPGYHCRNYSGHTNRGMSFFGWLDDDSSTYPVNTATSCYGGAASNSTKSNIDPAWNFLSGTTAVTARTLSACLEMRYVGTTSACAGEYVVLPDVNISTLVNQNTSVDELFTLADKVSRMSLAPVDVIFRPADDDCIQRTESPNLVSTANDSPVLSGVTGISPSAVGVNPPHQRAIVIAFRGVQQPASATCDVLRFSATKIIEWIPQSGSGINMTSRHIPGPSIDSVTNRLDAVMPSWQTPDPGSSLVARISDAALAGVTKTASKMGESLLNKGLGWMEKEIGGAAKLLALL